MSIHVAVVCMELHLPAARSLKDKRRVIRSLVDRLFKRYRVSVAETGRQELHQSSELTVAVVASSPKDLQKILDNVNALADETSGAVLVRWDPYDASPTTEWVAGDDDALDFDESDFER
ncbi:MAG: DUF503 domain-containing protein [Acidobacteriota bacterium]